MSENSEHGDFDFTRRCFIQRVTFFGGSALLFGACKRESSAPAKSSARALTTSHKTFTDEELETLAAVCERILPADEDPGARALGVPEYIDRALADGTMSHVRDDFVRGTEALMRRSQRLHQKPFVQLAATEQDALISSFKDAGLGTGEAHYYELLVALTMEGALSDPSYGGNKDREGWALVGFGTTEPPPGFDGMKALHHHRG